jgi:hypothetical protein
MLLGSMSKTKVLCDIFLAQRRAVTIWISPFAQRSAKVDLNAVYPSQVAKV